MVRLLPDPWVCQTTPTRWSPSSPPRLPARLIPAARLPNHPFFPLQLRRPQGFTDSSSDGVELVVAGHFLDQLAAAVVIEHDEVADQFQETLRLAGSL